MENVMVVIHAQTQIAYVICGYNYENAAST